MDTNKALHEIIGERILCARRRNNLTQLDLAQKVNVSQTTISRIEKGTFDSVSQELISQIATTLKLEEPDLNAEEPPPQKPSRKICPNPGCTGSSSRLEVSLHDKSLILRIFPHSTLSGAHCSFCGERLLTRCPDCGEVINVGACCTHCGGSYIPSSLGQQLLTHLNITNQLELQAYEKGKEDMRQSISGKNRITTD